MSRKADGLAVPAKSKPRKATVAKPAKSNSPEKAKPLKAAKSLDVKPAAGKAKAPRKSRAGKLSSRELLLEAGRIEFSTKGLEGARVDEIAQRAGVNKQLVYHHFNNKDDFYKAVLETCYAQIRAAEHMLDLGNADPLEAMRRLVSFSFDYLERNRDFVALLNDENQHKGRHLKASRELLKLHSPLIAQIADTLARGGKTGCFRSDVDPVHLYISIAGLSFFYFSNIHTLSSIFSSNFNGKNQIATRRAHVVDMVIHALRPD